MKELKNEPKYFFSRQRNINLFVDFVNSLPKKSRVKEALKKYLRLNFSPTLFIIRSDKKNWNLMKFSIWHWPTSACTCLPKKRLHCFFSQFKDSEENKSCILTQCHFFKNRKKFNLIAALKNFQFTFLIRQFDGKKIHLLPTVLFLYNK